MREPPSLIVALAWPGLPPASDASTRLSRAENWTVAVGVQRITLRFANRRDTQRFFPDTALTINSLEVIEGTLAYSDKCYGDWDIGHI